MSAITYTGLNGMRYTHGRKLGQGGEGAVYEVREDHGLVIKIYSHDLTQERIEKLTYMASISSPELNKFAAWPLDVARDDKGKARGFTMRKLVAFVPLHMLFSPMERKKLFADKGYNYLVHVARNLAMAFYKIHQMGIIIGDVNEANILVNPNGMVAMIDCDSFQVKNGKRYHFCEVGVPRYTPPELLEKGSFTNVVRTVNTDAFSLATLIFQLLFLGRAPFTGINQTKGDYDEEKAIREKEFAYSLRKSHKKLLPAKFSLSLRRFPAEISKNFHKAFEEESHRPTPKDWVMALDEMYKQLVECKDFKIHYYPHTMQECPWCRFNAEEGIVFFLDETHLTPVTNLSDIDRFVNGYKPEKLNVKKLSENYAVGNLTAAPIDKKFYNLKKKSWMIYGAIAALTIVACLLVGWICVLAGLIGILLSNLFFPTQVKLKEELAARQKRFDNLKTRFRSIIRQHSKPAEMEKYNRSAARLDNLVKSFRYLPTEFAANKKRIEEKYFNAKYKYYLFQFDISQHKIPAFGEAKKKLLYDNGIRNAADIEKLNSRKVPGIGPKNIQTLISWQKKVGKDFKYQPDPEPINKEINAAANQVGLKRRQLEGEIRNEYKALQVIKAGIKVNAQTIERQYLDAARKLYQAELDLEAFRDLMRKI